MDSKIIEYDVWIDNGYKNTFLLMLDGHDDIKDVSIDDIISQDEHGIRYSISIRYFGIDEPDIEFSGMFYQIKDSYEV